MAADFSSPALFVLFLASLQGQSASVLGDSVSLLLSVAPLFDEENPKRKEAHGRSSQFPPVRVLPLCKSAVPI